MSINLKVTLGNPDHGWLPVQITAPDFKLEFDASDVPTDSLNMLVNVLLVVLEGRDAEMTWFLEPAEYLMRFYSIDQQITLVILEKTNEKAEPVSLFKITGSASEIVKPFWQALRQYQSIPENLEKWEYEFPSREMELLGEVVKNLA